MVDDRRVTRRRLVAALSGAVALGVRWATTAAQGAEGGDTAQAGLAEVPTTGGRRPGPVSVETIGAPEPPPSGVAPVAIQIDKAAVDAPIERVDIVDGVMQNPSGPWVVSWYDDLAAPGEGSNVVMAGHLDYWDVGPAVFWNLPQLVPGDRLRVFGEDDRVFEYATDWIRNFVVADMTPEEMAAIVGPIDAESLTLITCAVGTWDPVKQEYRERLVLRATQVV